MPAFQKTAKVILIVVFLAVVLGVTILLGKQASSSYFAKASSCPVLMDPAEKAPKALQVSGNSAVVSWETQDVTAGRVEYGTSPSNLAFSAPEATSGKTHTVPLSLLTPNTRYHYVITIGDNKCDATGLCKGDQCVPFYFDTLGITPQQEIQATLVQEPTVAPTTSALPTSVLPTSASAVSASPSGSPTGTALSAFCQQVEKNIGQSDKDTAKWPDVKQYDIDGNGIILGNDIFKCKASGK